jgi:phosphatidylserine decarboxylase
MPSCACLSIGPAATRTGSTDGTTCAMPAALLPSLVAALPHHALGALVHRLTRCRTPWLKDLLIRQFCRARDVSLADAEHGDAAAYATFNAFFTRALRPGVRPMDSDPDAIVSPVDGRVSQAGIIERGQIIQAKGRSYSVAALLGGDAAEAVRFDGGAFATLYLAPHNYHRVHMPCAGTLVRMRYLPGRLFSVNEASVAAIDRLFARNERIVCEFDGPGRFVVCLVGALFVGSIETVWHGAVTPAPRRDRREYDYAAVSPPRALARGEEMGRFNMGSTVIVLFEPGKVAWEARLASGAEVRVGNRIGKTAAGGWNHPPAASC